MTPDDANVETVRAAFASRGIELLSATARAFPNETIVVVEVPEEVLADAVRMSSEIETTLPGSYLLVVRGAKPPASLHKGNVSSVNDERVSKLIELLNERSRTSEQQPSLEYIKDAAENLRVAVTRRHHVIFGRRGVGKTALLLEAKRQIEKSGSLVLWINIQVLRGLDAQRAFLTIVQRVCELPLVAHRNRTAKPGSVDLASTLGQTAQKLADQKSITREQVAMLVPAAQRLIAMLCTETGSDLFIFIDDLHYLEMKEQPYFLDLLHGITRDTAAWLKVAGIRNQCRTFVDNPPTGLQIGHDAAEIALDITLEEPKKARAFLTHVLQTYLNASNIANRSGFMASGAVDRLVLASAGVPRDFLRLTARSIQIARLRDDARSVGAQDVNEAAGEAGKQKRTELEDDAASSAGQAASRLTALERVRAFTIAENHHSFFRVGLKDKASNPDEYRLLQSLTDLRMVHLIKGSLSEAHAAGERSEVYMVDLSEYSGSRFKQDLTVIELRGDTLVLRKTGKDGKSLAADTARKIVQILRTGPEFKLQQFSDLVDKNGSG
ncbi:MAG TPA: ATP-binding protein [Pseudolabrys sp.]|nr:ATP-binding protein [Pseudolabrys sp.]